jgi:crossover junction endodeoxyribonuclease RusA
MIELILPWPPSLNHYWRNVKGMTLISAAGRKYRKEVARIIAESGLKPITGAVAVKRILYCPDYKRRDEDNLPKALNDAITKSGLWKDDSYICAVIVEKRKSADKEGRVVLQIKPLTKGVIVKNTGAWLE